MVNKVRIDTSITVSIYPNVSISVEEEVLKLKAAERVWQDSTQSVIAQVEPA